MTHNAVRITSAGIAIAAVAVISFATDTSHPSSRSFDPSVPSAWEVFHSNDGRDEGNTEDKTF
jgi:hypothetical protein